MFSFITSRLPTSFLPGWLTLETNPLDCLLQGEFYLFSLASILLQAVKCLQRVAGVCYWLQIRCYVTPQDW